MTAYVGIDLHRCRSVVVCLNERGERLWWRRIENSPQTLMEVVAEAGPAPEVVTEATWGWYWAADVVAEAGRRMHLAHPLGIKGYENRRVKTDWRESVGDGSGPGSGPSALQEVRPHKALAFDLDVTSVLEVVVLFQQVVDQRCGDSVNLDRSRSLERTITPPFLEPQHEQYHRRDRTRQNLLASPCRPRTRHRCQ